MMEIAGTTGIAVGATSSRVMIVAKMQHDIEKTQSMHYFNY